MSFDGYFFTTLRRVGRDLSFNAFYRLAVYTGGPVAHLFD